MNKNPYSSPHNSGEAQRRKPGPWISRFLEVLAVFGIIAILLAFLLPATRSGVGEAARRTQCANNLKQIGIALRNYESVHHALPPAYTVDAEGKPLHSWRTLILPFMEQQALYDSIDLSKPWDDPVNKAPRETFVATYRCPSIDGPKTHTTYLAIVAPGGCFRPTEPIVSPRLPTGTI